MSIIRVYSPIIFTMLDGFHLFEFLHYKNIDCVGSMMNQVFRKRAY